MFPRGIKTNIIIVLAIILIVAMLLVDFIMMIMVQKDLIRSESSKGHLLLSILGEQTNIDKDSGRVTFKGKDKNRFEQILLAAGFSYVMVLDKSGHEVYVAGKNDELKGELKRITSQAMRSKEKRVEYLGKTWGVFWKSRKEILFSAPLFHEGQIYAGAGVVLPLAGIYKTMRHTQQILFIYILINTLILMLLGFYRLSKVYLQPLLRLVKRAEEYKDEDEEIFFSVRQEDDELGKLSTALNRLLARISMDREKLRSTVLSLEQANLELKQAQNEIIRAEKLASVGRLSSGIAHEIGNPIGIVIGYLDLLKKGNLSSEDRSEYIKRAEDEINRINKIIQQLLNFSRPSPKDPTAVSVHDIINDISNVLESQPLMSNMTLKLVFEAEKDTVFADADQLRQVFLNLIINAADAISSDGDKNDGELKIQTLQLPLSGDGALNRHETLKIMFVDNGPGIPKGDIANIFDPFYTTKEPGKGTGLGLSVSFMIIEGLGGTMEAGSEEGQGTTMTILLPLYALKT